LEALRQTPAHAVRRRAIDLEEACGWGSCAGWLRQFPNAEISAVSNSHRSANISSVRPLRAGLKNLRVVTADINVFDPERKFDRIVSIEMFEAHHELARIDDAGKIVAWADGRFFMHIFTHRSGAICSIHAMRRLDRAAFFRRRRDAEPSSDRQYTDLFEVEKEWRWSGTHYQRTASTGSAIRLHRDEIRGHPSQRLRGRHRLWMRRCAGSPRHIRAVRLRPTAANGVSHYR